LVCPVENAAILLTPLKTPSIEMGL
jgi:hypothetical protein